MCEGLPLALRIIGNRLVSRPGWDAAELAARLADEERRLDQFKAGDLKIASAFWDVVRAARRFRTAGVPAAGRGTWPRTSTPPSRRSRAGCRSEDAWDALDELVDLGLLQDSAAGRYRFHDLVRLFARARLEEESLAEREALTGG